MPAARTVVVLAAGQGTRMRSTTPKVLHRVAGRSMLAHVVGAARQAQADRVAVVVGHDRDRVVAEALDVDPAAEVVVQETQDGTGHAARVALAALDEVDQVAGTVVVVPGDAPLLSGATLDALAARREDDDAAVVLLTSELDDPTGYGRVLRDDDGRVRAVVEERDADDAQRSVREVATSVYAFDATLLREALGRLSTDNAQGEEYLTDVVALLVADGRAVAAVRAPAEETAGVNDRAQLADAATALRRRLVREHQRAGVGVEDGGTTYVDATVELEPDATVLPGCRLTGATVVRAGAVVGPDAVLHDTVVEAGARVRSSTCEGAVVGPGATVGPYSYLRPGAVLGPGTKVGAFVEIKASTLAEGAKVPHLSYVGDAEIGAGSNVGAATVVVNYDGVHKHRTVVGAEVRIGSDTMLVAPVTVGDGAYTAAGSVVTEDVPPGALAVGRARQHVVEGWVERRRPGSPAALAAAAAQDGARGDDPETGTTGTTGEDERGERP